MKRPRKFLKVLSRIFLLIFLGFVLGVWQAPTVQQLSAFLTDDISLSQKGQELSQYYQNINRLKIQLADLKGFLEIRTRQFSLQQKVLNEALKKQAKDTDDQYITVGPSSYTLSELDQDIKIRRSRCELLENDIQENRRLIGDFDQRLTQLIELTESLEGELKSAKQSGEITKAKLDALVANDSIASGFRNWFFLPYGFRLTRAQRVLEKRVQAAQIKQEADLALEKTFLWYEPVIPDVYWLEPFIKQERSRELVTEGLGYLAKNEFDQAMSCFNQALDFDDSNLEADQYIMSVWINQGASLWKEGEYERAIRFFNQVLERDPQNVSALTKKATCLVFQQNYKSAFDTFALALTLDSDCHEAAINFAGLLMFRNQSRRSSQSSGCSSDPIMIREDWSTALAIYSLILNDSRNAEFLRIASESVEIINDDIKSSKVKIEFVMIDDNHHLFSQTRKDNLSVEVDTGVEKQIIQAVNIASFSNVVVNPNALCPCGSGRKYKNCHGQQR